LGIEQGGFEVSGFADRRPAPSGFFANPGALNASPLPAALEEFAVVQAADFESWTLTDNSGGAHSGTAQAITFPATLYQGTRFTPSGVFVGSLKNVQENLENLGDAIEEETTQSEELVRVLEFSLGDEYYCLDIEYVEEIVKRDAVTRVPNTADFVDGVVDLRGQITTILEPKEMMDIETEGEQNLIIVFDPDKFEDQGAVGWVVDEVRQVVPITESEVNSPPVDAEYINGVIDREEYDQFVIWIEPDDALAQATGGDEE
jgi:chemotaxis signal transduction protein